MLPLKVGRYKYLLTYKFYYSDGKESAYNAADPGLISGWGRSAGEGNGNPLQYSCLENPKDRGAWRATVHTIEESEATERLTF